MSADNVPVHFTEATFIGTVPAGAKLIAVGLKVMVVAPDIPASWVTPTGLVPIYDGTKNPFDDE